MGIAPWEARVLLTPIRSKGRGEIMAILKPTPTAVIDEATLALSTATVVADCTNIDLTKAMQCAITVQATFDASATENLDITLRPSYNGTDYDTAAWQSWTWHIAAPSSATPIRLTSYPISPVCKGMKVIVSNTDSTYAVTGLKVYVTVQTAG